MSPTPRRRAPRHPPTAPEGADDGPRRARGRSSSRPAPATHAPDHGNGAEAPRSPPELSFLRVAPPRDQPNLLPRSSYPGLPHGRDARPRDDHHARCLVPRRPRGDALTGRSLAALSPTADDADPALHRRAELSTVSWRLIGARRAPARCALRARSRPGRSRGVRARRQTRMRRRVPSRRRSRSCSRSPASAASTRAAARSRPRCAERGADLALQGGRLRVACRVCRSDGPVRSGGAPVDRATVRHHPGRAGCRRQSPAADPLRSTTGMARSSPRPVLVPARQPARRDRRTRKPTTPTDPLLLQQAGALSARRTRSTAHPSPCSRRPRATHR